jgi:hypothetical protein
VAGGPLIPEGIEVAALLSAVAAFLLAYGLLAFYRVTLKPILLGIAAVFGVVRVGGFGHYARPLEPIVHAIEGAANGVDDALAAVVLANEHAIGFLWSQLARQTVWLGRTLGGFAYAVEQRFAHVAAVEVPDAVLRAMHATTVRVAKLTGQVAHVANVAVPDVRAGVGALRRYAHHELDALRIGYGRLARAVTVTLPADIRALDVTIGRTAKQARAHARRLTRLEELLGASAFAALTLSALGKLGLNWIRCPALSRVSKKHGCSPWQTLEHLLAPALDVLAFMDICAVAKLVRVAARTSRPVLRELLPAAQSLSCVGKHEIAAALPIHGAARPTVTVSLPL